MKKDMDIVKIIKSGDIQRKNFFINKLMGDLKKYIDNYTREDIEKYFMEAVDSYTEETTINFYNYVLNYVKKALNPNIDNEKKNDIFSEMEMTVIDDYFGLKDGVVLSNYEISIKRNISTFLVGRIILKFKNTLAENPKKVREIYPECDSFFKRRKKLENKIYKTEVRDLSNEEIELIGIYTGQVYSLALGINELAERYDMTVDKMEEKLRKAFLLIDRNKNFETLIKKYPHIIKALEKRSQELGIDTLNKIVMYKGRQGQNNKYDQDIKILQRTYQRNKDNELLKDSEVAKSFNLSIGAYKKKVEHLLKKVENDKDFQKQLAKVYPDFYKDKSQYEKNRTYSNEVFEEEKVINDLNEEIDFASYLKLLKIMLTKEENGKYLSMEKIATNMGVEMNNFLQLREKLLEEVLDSKEFSEYLDVNFPNYKEKLEEYKKFITNKKEKKKSKEEIKALNKEKRKEQKIKTYEEYTKILKLILTKNEGKYLLNTELADKLGLSLQYISVKKKNIFNCISNDADFNKYLDINYPTFKEDLQDYKNRKRQKKQEKEIDKESIYKEYEKILRLVFQKKEDGEYLKVKEISEVLQVSTNTVNVRKRKIFKAIENDKDFEQYLSKNYPTFKEDLQLYKEYQEKKEIRKEESKKKQKRDKYKEYLELLKVLVEKKEDGEYLSIKEASELMNVHYNSVRNRLTKIKNLLETDKEFRKYLEEIDPSIIEKFTMYKDKTPNSLEKRKRDFENYVDFLKVLYSKDEYGNYKSIDEVAKEVNLSTSDVILKRKTIYRVSSHNEEFKKYLEENYPNYWVEKEAYTKYSKMMNSTRAIQKTKEEKVKFLKLVYTPKEDGTYTKLVDLASNYKVSTQTISNRINTLTSLIETDIYFKKYLEEVYPTYLEDKLKYENYKKKEKSKDEINNVKFLKTYYQKKDDGTFRSKEEVASLCGIKTAYVTVKLSNELKKYKTNENFREYLLEEYPEFEKDRENYLPKKKRTSKKEKNHNNLVFLQKILEKDEKDNYLEIDMLKEKLQVTEEEFYKQLKKIEDKLTSDLVFDDYINTKIDNFREKYLKFREEKTDKSLLDESLMISIDEKANFLKIILGTNSFGKYLIDKELEDKLKIDKRKILQRKRQYINLLDNNLEFRKKIEEIYPTVMEDLDKYRNNKRSKEEDRKYNKYYDYSNFIKAMVQVKEDGSYPTYEELAEKFKITINTARAKKSYAFMALNDNEEFKKYLEEVFPNYLEEVEKMLNYKLVNNNSRRLSETEKYKRQLIILQTVLSKNDKGYLSNYEIALKLGKDIEKVPSVINALFKNINNDYNLRSYLNDNYPNYLEDIKKYQKEKEKNLVKEKYQKKISFLQSVYEKKEDGQHYTYDELSKRLNMSKDSIKIKVRKITTLIEKDLDFSLYLEENYPNYLEDAASFKATLSKNKLVNDMDDVCEFLKLLFNYNVDEVMEKLKLNKNQIEYRRNRIFKLVNDPKYLAKVIEKYPTFLEDRKKYEEKLNNNSEVFKENLEFLKIVLQRKEDGSFYNISELKETTGYSEKRLLNKIRYLFTKAKNNEEFKKYLGNNYSDFEDIKKDYQYFLNYTSKEDEFREKAEELLKIFNNKDKYSNEELSKLFNTSKSSFVNHKEYLVALLRYDNYFRDFVTKNYPELLEQDRYEKEQLKAKKYVRQAEFLQLLYTKDKDGNYLDYGQIAKKMNLSRKAITTRKNTIYKELKDNDVTINYFKDNYPELLEEKVEYDKVKQQRKKDNSKKTFVKNVNFLKNIYALNDDNLKTITEVAEKVNLSEKKLKTKIKKIYSTYENNEEFREYVNNYYPTFLEEKEKWDRKIEGQDTEKREKKYEEYLKYLLIISEKDAKGNYYDTMEIADKIGITRAKYYYLRNKIIKLLENDKDFREYLNTKEPNMTSEIEMIKNTSSKNYKQGREKHYFEEYVAFLKDLCKKRKEESLYTNNLNLETDEKRYNIAKKFHNNLNFKNYIKENYPDLYEEIINSKILDIKIDTKKDEGFDDDLVFLKDMFLRKENGYLNSFEELEKTYGVLRSTLNTRKTKLLKRLVPGDPFYEYILKNDAKLLEIVLEYKKKNRSEQNSIRNYERIMQFLELVTSKKKNGEYISTEEIAKQLKINYNSVKYRIKLTFNNYLNNKTFREYVEKYKPSLLEEIENYEKKQKPNSRSYNKDLNKTYKNYLYFMQVVCKRNSDGSLKTTKDICQELGIALNTIIYRINQCNKLLNEDEGFKNYILNREPNLIYEYNLYLKTKKTRNSLTKMIDFIKTVYKETDDGYLSIEDICKKYNMGQKNFYRYYNKYIKLIEEDRYIREEVIRFYPEFVHDKNKRDNTCPITKRIVNYDLYEENLQDSIIQSNFKISKSLNVSLDELEKIKENALVKDIPNITVCELEKHLTNKRKFEAIIKRLEESIYKDFIELCNYQQKVILALRLGFFNRRIFSNEEVAEVMGVSSSYVDLLVNECLKFIINDNSKPKTLEKE